MGYGKGVILSFSLPIPFYFRFLPLHQWLFCSLFMPFLPVSPTSRHFSKLPPASRSSSARCTYRTPYFPGFLPIDDIICSRMLYLLHKISFGHCPDYFISYIHYLKDTHNYNTKATTKNNLVLPKNKRGSGCRTFHTSAIHLWNNVDVLFVLFLSYKQFIGKVQQKLLKQNAALEHFKIRSIF